MDISEILEEVVRSLPNRVYLHRQHDISDDEAFIVELGSADVNTEFSGLDRRTACTHIEYTIYVSYRSRVHPEDMIRQVVDAHATIIESLRSIHTEKLTLQSLDEPEVGIGDAYFVEARTEWLFRVDV